MMISTENVTKVYNPGMPDERTALRGISIGVGRGEVAVLRGPSGSGKTSLLSLIGCMSRPESGRILIDGQDVAKLPERFLTDVRRRKFGFIFQQFNLVRNISVLENVLLPLYPSNVTYSEMKDRGMRLLMKMKIEDKRDLKVKKLSGGEQQRVVIARAMISDPDIIIADEPTAHLDRELSIEMLEILASLNREGRTILMASHDPLVVDSPMVNRTIAMRDGMVEAVETG